MNDIIEYNVAMGTDAAKVTEIVQTAIDNGWEPLGSLTTTAALSTMVYAQSIVLRKTESEIRGVRYIEGKPADVEDEINCFLDQGWKLRGEQFTREENGVTVIVQCMTNDFPKGN